MFSLVPITFTFHSLLFVPMVHLYPVPDAEGIAKSKDFYLNRVGRTLTDEESYAVLNSVMHFLYLRSLPDE
jgi:hypothetical protein